MFSRNPNLRTHDFFFRKFYLVSFKTGQNFNIEIKHVAKTVYFHKKKYFAAPLKKEMIILCEKQFLDS